MEEFIVEHHLGEVAVIGDFTFSTKELKEGRYTVKEELDDNGDLATFYILHESIDRERDERLCGSEPFTGFFQVNKNRNILLPQKPKFPSGKKEVAFVLNNGQDIIGLTFVAFDPPAKGRRKYAYNNLSEC